MTPTNLVPLDLPVGLEHHGGHALGLLDPLLGFGVLVLVVAMLVAAYVLLRRKGFLPPFALPAWSGPARSPEAAARQLLAERFARGDISTEDFLERASILNWTPGSDAYPPRRVGRR